MQDNMLRSLKNFLDMMIVEKSSSNNTITSYKNDIIDLFAFLKKNNITLTLISYKEIDLYVMHLYKLNLTNATIARKISAIRTFFAFLLSDGMIDNNPTIELLLPKKNILFQKL